MQACWELAPYYLQLEDDVITVPGYFGKIRAFVEKQEGPWAWAVLEYSRAGFIGKLLSRERLGRLIALILAFYEEQPVDFLLQYYNMLQNFPATAEEGKAHEPALFLHQGRVSSLAGKRQFVEDEQGNVVDDGLDRAFAKVHHGDNPPAELSMSFSQYEDYEPAFAYDHGSKPFWGGNILPGDTFTVRFTPPCRLQRVIVETGNQANQPGENDILAKGGVFVR